MNTSATNPDAGLMWKATIFLVLLAAGAFHLSFYNPTFSFAIVAYLACLIELTRASSARRAFYSGLTLGFLVFAPKLSFFYTIFGPAAVPLWAILSFWHGLFVLIGYRTRSCFSNGAAIFLIPVFWIAFEYFRSELYWLKFSWLAPSFAFPPNQIVHWLGSYGVTAALMLLLVALRNTTTRPWAISSILICTVSGFASQPATNPPRKLALAGIQLEFPVLLEVPSKLDLVRRKFPDADIYVLSEYTFDGPPPKCVRDWCRKNSKYLACGGKDPAPKGNYFNTAFVIDPNGDIVFRQVKAVPIQFFKDGLPAPAQSVWESPWGKIGICTCYDLSYTRVVDCLVRQGAQMIINPTMDVADWGREQHELHSLIPPMRAAEYGIPIFRIASSGISQAIDERGSVVAMGSFPGEEDIIGAQLSMASRGTLPADRFVAPASVAATAAIVLWMFGGQKLVPRKDKVKAAHSADVQRL